MNSADPREPEASGVVLPTMYQSRKDTMKRVLAAGLLGSALLSSPAVAQTSVQDVPASLQPLGLTDVEVRPKFGDRGRDIIGTLPGGARIEIELDRNDRVEEIEATDRQGFPASGVESLIPEAVRANPSYPGDGTFRKVDFDDDEIELEGTHADGRRFEAEFLPTGELRKIENR